MIHIKETYPSKESVVIQVAGKLDRKSLGIFKSVCDRHLGRNPEVKITLGFSELTLVCRDGIEYLRSIRDSASFPGLAEDLRLEIFHCD